MLGPVVRGPISAEEASQVPSAPSARESKRPRRPGPSCTGARIRCPSEGRGSVAAGSVPQTQPRKEKRSRGDGAVSREQSSGATPPEGSRTSAARVRLGRCVTWPGGYRGDGAGARGTCGGLAFLPGPRWAPGARAAHGSRGRLGCGRRPGSSSGTPTSPPRTPRCSPASPRRWPSSARTSHGGGPRWGCWRGSRTSGRAPNLG